MKRQLMLAAAVLAAGSAFGLTSPAAQAHGYDRPPPPRHDIRPAPRPGQAWVPGHYDRMHGDYAWRGGYYQAARPGYRYVPDGWVHGPHGWVRRPGYWAR
ncbi:hypothetical protein [Cupriavidus campinensis]